MGNNRDHSPRELRSWARRTGFHPSAFFSGESNVSNSSFASSTAPQPPPPPPPPLSRRPPRPPEPEAEDDTDPVPPLDLERRHGGGRTRRRIDLRGELEIPAAGAGEVLGSAEPDTARGGRGDERVVAWARGREAMESGTNARRRRRLVERGSDRLAFITGQARSLPSDPYPDVNSMQPSRVTDFGALASARFRIESLANLNTNTLFDLKPNTHTIINDPLQFGNYRKSISPTDITTTAAATTTTVGPQALIQQKGAQPNLVALRTGNIENWGESTMADTSPRTDTSTDPDIDERNHMVLEV